MTIKIKFLPYNKTCEVEKGDTVINCAMKAGIHINASCGGEGVCGKCRIIVEEGEVLEGISEKLDDKDIENKVRLACLAELKEDITIRIPIESTDDKSALNIRDRKTANLKEIDFENLKEKGLFIPPVEKKYLELPKPDNTDNSSDVTRLINYLKAVHEEKALEVSFDVIRKISDLLRESDFKVTATLVRPVRESRRSYISNMQPSDTTNENYGIAIDIGTTTIYGELIDINTGKKLARYGDFNAQISCGEDVISRIVFAEKGGLEKLSELVLGVINNIIKKIIKKAGVLSDNISTIALSGNTTMTQLFLKINPKFIRRSPYVPTATLYPSIKASEIGIDLPEHTTALIYPGISSYVGGDIVSGVMGSGLYLSDKLTLFMDIGTNAEIVIGNKDWMACAACSAGPAFEGGGIKFGMRASKGAIEDFSINPITFEPMIMTVKNVKPKGICGSGLINMVAMMFESGLINSQGKFDTSIDNSRIRKNNDVMEYVISWADETQIEKDIALTEIDIDNLIRAKGAIYSGVMTLLEEIGLSISDIEHIILAGGFGSYIDLEKAMTIGLLPEIDHEKVSFIGNSSLTGAGMSVVTNKVRKDVVAVTNMMTNFELSETKSYMDNYMAALFLPHTDINLFPKFKERMNKS
jgi:uncharacterized 2Fe-2S/4Fe-4S cluster protein (DUF4445 family)